jgi:LytS/YehU family sensor histidine kinase
VPLGRRAADAGVAGQVTNGVVVHQRADVDGGDHIVFLEARRDGDVLRVEIRNDVREGRQVKPGHGIGIANTRARLREMYGGSASLELFPSPRSMTVVLSIPFRSFPT